MTRRTKTASGVRVGSVERADGPAGRAARAVARSRRGSSRCGVGFALLVVLVVGASAAAREESADVGGVHCRVIAPEWIWQGDSLNVLVVLDGGHHPVGVEVELTVPEEGFRRIAERAAIETVALDPGEARRFAFRDITARADVPRATHELVVRVRVPPAGGSVVASAEFRLAVMTLRGSSAPSARSSIFVPAALALLAVPLFLVFLRRYAARGSWKTVRQPSIPQPEAAWWESR